MKLCFLKKITGSIWFLVLALALITPTRSDAKGWLLGVVGGGLFSHDNQKDFNALIQNTHTNAAHFNKQYRPSWTVGVDFISTSISNRVSFGLRYEQLTQTVSGTDYSANTKTKLLMFSENIYLLGFRRGLNIYSRLALGAIQSEGAYSFSTSSIGFKGNYFVGQAGGGLELILFPFSVTLEAYYQYARVPKLTITSASGAAFSDLSTNSTLYLIQGASSNKMTLNFTGVTYAASAKFYF